MKTPMMELIEQLNSVKPTQFCSIETIKGWAEEMLEKEKEVAQKYAEFAIECDRKKLPVLEFDGWINL